MRWLLLAPLVGAACLALALSAAAAPGLEAPHLLEDRGPIRIDRDADFDAAHGVRSGSGTLEDPFLIAHWRIASTSEVAVRVANTTRAFVLRNLELAGQCAATPCNLEAGIHLQATRGGSVVHNLVRGMDRAGISVEMSAGPVEVVENHVQGGGAVVTSSGIHLRNADGAEVRGNLVEGVGPAEGTAAATAGIRVWDSDDVLVADNEVRNNTEAGLALLAVRRVEVVDNVLTANDLGLTMQGRDALVRYNAIASNRRYGVLLSSGFLRLDRNDIAFNGKGVELASGTNATLRSNNLAGHTDHALEVERNSTADAEQNYWGHASGPNVAGQGPGTGERISLGRGAVAAQVGFRPFLPGRVAESGTDAPRPSGNVVTSATPSSGPPGEPGSVAPRGPVAVLEGPAAGNVATLLSFSAARSFDVNGDALRYAWQLGDGTATGGLRAQHAYNATGEYVVRLTVTDSTGLSSSASVLLNITRAPLGVALLASPTVARGEELLLQAQATGQPLAPVTFRFTTRGPGTFDGPAGSVNSTRVRLDAPGEHIVGVEALAPPDPPATAFLRVLVANRPPVAVAEVAPEQGDTRTEFRFSAAGSTDPDNDTLSFTWDLGDGQQASGANATRRFALEGRHVVVLVASDGFSASEAQVVVDVGPAPAPPPAANTPGPAAALVVAALALASRAASRRRR